MRRRRPWEEEDRDIGLQIAPLLDLLFVMLLFFMVTAGSKRSEREMALSLSPGVGASATAAAAPLPLPLRIDIDVSGRVLLNRIPVGEPGDAALPGLRERLQRAVSAAGEEAPLVIVTPSLRTRQERVVEVLGVCGEAQVRRLSFGTP